MDRKGEVFKLDESEGSVGRIKTLRVQCFHNLVGVRNGVVKEDGWSNSIEEKREVCTMSNVR